MTKKINVSSEVCIWKALEESLQVRKLENAARRIAKEEYKSILSHAKFQNGFKNLENANMIIFEIIDTTTKIYQRNPKAAKRDVQLLEIIGDEYRVIKNIRKLVNGFEAKLEDFQALNDEDKELTQLAVTNRKEMLLARISLFTLIQCEKDCPKFLESDIATQKDHATALLADIHDILKKFDERLASQSSFKLWRGAEKEIAKIATEYEKLNDYYSKN